jgi:hypothetical protein
MPRGGKRPGAGAPKGNLNALRTGARSKQVKTVMLALLIVPETRRVLLHFRRMEERRRLELAEAMNEYALLAKRLRAKGRGGLVPGSLFPVPSERSGDARSIKPKTAPADSQGRAFFRDNHSSEGGAAEGGAG